MTRTWYHRAVCLLVLLGVTPTDARAQAPGGPTAPEPAPGEAPSADGAPLPVDAMAPSEVDTPALDLLPLTPRNAGGLTAAEASERAVAYSPRVRAAEATTQNAQRRADRAYSLYVPRLDLTASYRRLSPVDYALPGFTLDIPLNSTSLRAALRVQASDYFLTLGDYYDSAQQQQLVRRHQQHAEAQAVAFQARVAYCELARAAARHKLSQHRVAQLQLFLDEIQMLVEGGEAGGVDLGLAKVRHAAAHAAAASDQSAFHSAENALRQQVGLTEGQPVGVAEPLTTQLPDPPGPLPELLERAQQQRPEALALRALVAANEHTEAALSAERFPDIALVGDVNTDNPNQRYFPIEEKFRTTWSVGVQLAWSPSDLATQNDRLDDAELAVTRARQDLRGLRDRISREVSDAYEQAAAAHSVVDTLRESVEAAEETLRIYMALFHSGEATSRDVLDAELDLRGAQLQWVDAAVATHVARAALDHATGDLAY